MPFLNQKKGENDHRKDFMINLHERMQGSNLRPPDNQFNLHLIAQLRPAVSITLVQESILIPAGYNNVVSKGILRSVPRLAFFHYSVV